MSSKVLEINRVVSKYMLLKFSEIKTKFKTFKLTGYKVQSESSQEKYIHKFKSTRKSILLCQVYMHVVKNF